MKRKRNDALVDQPLKGTSAEKASFAAIFRHAYPIGGPNRAQRRMIAKRRGSK